jgi:hypothetical protein
MIFKKPQILYAPMLSSFGGGSARGFNPGGGGGGVDFTSFTFTDAKTYGRLGPTLSQALSVYDTATYTWLSDTSFYDVTSSGIQTFVVPASGTYKFTARAAVNNAKSFNTSNVAGTTQTVVGQMSLSEGDKLWIAVGQNAGSSDSRQTYTSSTFGAFFSGLAQSVRSNMTACGPGATFVGKGSSLSNTSVVIVSGAPGGRGGEAVNDNLSILNANQGEAGNRGNLGYGGTNGSGGQTTIGNTYGGGGGGGFLSSGTVVTGYGEPGDGFRQGASGAVIAANGSTCGGFGGGGSGQDNDEPAGGGGYSGGGGGGYSGSGGIVGSPRTGGGGGSHYSNLSNTSITAYTPSGTEPEQGFLTLEKL